VAGQTCWGSPGALGNNIPVNTSGSSTQIDDIDVIMSPNQSGNMDVVGWAYITPSGTYVQSNPAFPAFWTNIVTAIPVLGPFANAFNTSGIAPVGSALANQIDQYLNNHGGQMGSCFSSSLG
jgi:hypothetical protein